MPTYLEVAVDVAREASALLNEFARQRVGFELKGEHDLVTVADRASEKLIVERLQKEFPTHHILGEEGGSREGSSEYRWYVDPLDGTTNFAHGFPAYNVSIGLEHNGELIAGVVADPTRNEFFTAERGAGAFLAVTQGSPHREAGILHLSWQPKGARNPPRIALVGKGLCYDTGGVNVKTARYMYGMHQDMAGSAVALGVMLALRALDVPFALDCWLALAENHLEIGRAHV